MESWHRMGHRLGTDRTFGATYSPCGLYRYSLWRFWDGPALTILWIMLNPSTADDLGNNDPTIERCEKRSVAWGFNRMEVVNLFGFRATDPRALRVAADPVGPGNDEAVFAAADRADLILCGWGTEGRLRSRSNDMLALLTTRPLHCIGRTRQGEPAHPLYLSYARTPRPYRFTM